MSTHHAARILRDRSTGRWRAATQTLPSVPPTGDGPIRLLVLDRNPGTLEQIENALWTWPHKISTATNVEEAVRMCRHLEPAAVIASLDFSHERHSDIISTLRNELPQLAIIALGSSADFSSMADILESGADAILCRDELHRPTLYDLLTQLRSPPEGNCVSEIPQPAIMPLPWRESRIVGSLICDIKGTITSANECLAKWLAYATPSAMSGKCVWRDVLNTRSDWAPWKTVAGDMTALLHQSVTVKASNEQLLWMTVEVFAVPNSPSNLQALFVDQSELAHLSGRI